MFKITGPVEYVNSSQNMICLINNVYVIPYLRCGWGWGWDVPMGKNGQTQSSFEEDRFVPIVEKSSFLKKILSNNLAINLVIYTFKKHLGKLYNIKKIF